MEGESPFIGPTLPWRVIINKIVTKDNLLIKRIIMSSTLCIMCGEEDHVDGVNTIKKPICSRE